MITSYLKVALRNFLRYRLYTLINVLGLAAGLASCLLIGLFVRHELSYDRHYAQAERIYRVSRDLFLPSGDVQRGSTNSGPAAALLLQDFPQIEQAARLNTVTNLLLGRENDAFYESQLRFADAAFFELFDFEWLLGSPSTSLVDPASVVLTESLAAKYFGEDNPLGMTLMLDNRLPVQVTGVIADLPDNTHLSASGFVSIEALDMLYGNNGQGYLDSWFRLNTHTYILLKPGAGMEDIERGLAAFNERHVPNGGFRSAMRITALKDIHWMQAMNVALKAPASLGSIAIFSAIGICILVVACINFVNLSTARSSQRALEVGLRKSVGAFRSQLIRQFLGESIWLTLMAMLIALAFAELLLPAANSFLGQELAFGYLGEPLVMLGLIGATLLLGVLAGAYPAFSLSAFAPARVLKGEFTRGESGVVLRNTLVVLQFAVSIILLVATVVIFLQMNYISKLDLGFRKDQMVVLSLPDDDFAQWAPFRDALLAHPDITHVSSSDSIPMRIGELGGARKEGEANARTVSEISIDLDFFDTYDIALLAGRPFSADILGDRDGDGSMEGRGNLILNEQAAREFGWTPDEAVGKVLQHDDGVWKPVIGVVNNTVESARFSSNPILYQLPPEVLAGEEISIRISGSKLDETLDHIDSVWREFYPAQPIIRQFLDSMVEALYREERRHLELSFYFAILSIGIACLGLFGLAVFNAERRTKEIGVRKVMGGSVWSIVLLLTNDFSKLVLLSNLIAWPVAWFVMNRWLENFAYQIDLTPLVFIGSGLIALCIAWVTVGGTAAKAASAKPVLALRYE